MTEIIAYCGLTCTDCMAYTATQENNTEKLITLALDWYGVENDAAYCLCDGCITDGRKNHWCSECKVRACAINHEVANCAHCSDYGCEIISGFFADVPLAKETLDRIHLQINGN
jgi:hypothetical protein